MKKLLSLLISLMMITTLFTGCKKEEKRLLETHLDMFKNKKAYISLTSEYEADGMKMSQTQNIAVDGENMAMQIIMEMPAIMPLGFETRMIFQDKKLYLIDSMQMQVIEIDITEEYDEIKSKLETENSMFMVNADDLEFIQAGNEDFKDESLPFEEYKTPVGNCKYYFKDKKLVGMHVASDLFPEPLYATVNEVSNEYPKEIFDIPEDFTKLSAEEAGFELNLDEMFPDSN